jgi:uncharacterized membrane protein
LARRLLLPALLVPAMFGSLRLQGQRMGWYGTEVGSALMVTCPIVVLLALVWFTARALDAADARRRASETASHVAAERLAGSSPRRRTCSSPRRAAS